MAKITEMKDKNNGKQEDEDIDTTHLYDENLNGDIYTETNANPKVRVHATEWRKILNGAASFLFSNLLFNVFCCEMFTLWLRR